MQLIDWRRDLSGERYKTNMVLLFWESIKSDKLTLKAILPIGTPCKTFSFIDKMIVRICLKFSCFSHVLIFFTKIQFQQKSMAPWTWVGKTLDKPICVYKLQIYLAKYVSLSSDKWGFIALSYMEKPLGAPFWLVYANWPFIREIWLKSKTFTLARRKKSYVWLACIAILFYRK